jgi:hypothetical protein
MHKNEKNKKMLTVKKWFFRKNVVCVKMMEILKDS